MFFGSVALAAKPALNILPDTYFSKLKSGKTKYNNVRPQDSIYSILKNNGFNHRQINEVLSDSATVKQWALAKGDSYRIATADNSNFSEIRFYNLIRDMALVYWRDGNEAGTFETPAGLLVKLQNVQGQVRGSLLASIRAQVADDWVGMRFMDAFALDFKIKKQLRRGAVFSFVVEEKFDGNQFLGYGEILEAQLEIDGEIEVRQFVPFTGGGTFIEPTDIHLDRPLFSPVNYLRISSHFSSHRLHPIKRKRMAHMGIDFELPLGAKVLAARSGQVLRTGRTRGAGIFVVLRHNNGLETYYNHLESIALGIRAGVDVKDGQIIGRVGCTGYCTSPHLHFAVKKNSRYVDPATMIRSYPFEQTSLIRERLAQANHEE